MTISDDMGKKICALVDNELDHDDAAGSVRQICGDPELKQRWDRYHLISDVMRHKELLPNQMDLSLDFSQRISRAIESEPTVFAPGALPLRTRLLQTATKQLAGLAVAASVTVVVVFGVQYQGQGIPGGMEMAGTSSLSVPASQIAPVDSRSIPAHQFNKYLVNHHEHVGSTAVRHGVLPYARIAGGQPIGK